MFPFVYFAFVVVGLPAMLVELSIGRKTRLNLVGALMLMLLVAWLNPEKATEELEKGIGELGVAGETWV